MGFFAPGFTFVFLENQFFRVEYRAFYKVQNPRNKRCYPNPMFHAPVLERRNSSLHCIGGQCYGYPYVEISRRRCYGYPYFEISKISHSRENGSKPRPETSLYHMRLAYIHRVPTPLPDATMAVHIAKSIKKKSYACHFCVRKYTYHYVSILHVRRLLLFPDMLVSSNRSRAMSECPPQPLKASSPKVNTLF